MRTLLTIFCAAGLCLSAGAAHVYVTLTDFMQNALGRATVRMTLLTTNSSGDFIAATVPRQSVTGTNGIAWFSNTVAGVYRLQVFDNNSTAGGTWTMLVPDTTNSVSARSCLLGQIAQWGATLEQMTNLATSLVSSVSLPMVTNVARAEDVTMSNNIVAQVNTKANATNATLYGSVWSLNNEWRWLRAGPGSLKWQWAEEPEVWTDALILDEENVRFPRVPVVSTDVDEAPDRLTTQHRMTNAVVGIVSNGVPMVRGHFGDIATNRNTIMVVQGDSLSNDYTDWAWEHILTNGGWLARCWRTNFAVGGQTAATMSNVFNSTIATVAPRRWDEGWLFLWGGINDLAGGANATNVYGYLTNIWQRARDAKFKVVAFTLTHATNISDSAQQQRTNLNALIEGNPALYDYLIRAHLVLTNAADTNYFATDGIHPNALGSSLIAREVVNVLGREQPTLLVARAGTLGTRRDLVLKPSGGRVAIGRMDPAAELDVQGSVVARTALSVSNGITLGVYDAGTLGANRITFNRTDYGKTNEICFDHLDPGADGVIRWRRDALDLGFLSRTEMHFVIDAVNSATNRYFRWSKDSGHYNGTELMRLDEDGRLSINWLVVSNELSVSNLSAGTLYLSNALPTSAGGTGSSITNGTPGQVATWNGSALVLSNAPSGGGSSTSNFTTIASGSGTFGSLVVTNTINAATARFDRVEFTNLTVYGALNIATAYVDRLQFTNSTVTSNLNVGGGLNVGGPLFITNGLGVAGTTEFGGDVQWNSFQIREFTSDPQSLSLMWWDPVAGDWGYNLTLRTNRTWFNYTPHITADVDLDPDAIPSRASVTNIATNVPGLMKITTSTPGVSGTNSGVFWASNNTLYWTYTAGGTTTNTVKIAGP